jgi:mannose-6-phosphate isomerase-like protein (cupin superfamily)
MHTAATITADDVVTRAGEGRSIDLGGFGCRYLAAGDGFSLVEHPLAPGALGSPLHSHEHEDEYSYIVHGEVGIQVGDVIVYATAGDVVFKPRGVPHAFWNRADQPAKLLDLIVPGGFGEYFADVAAYLPPRLDAPDPVGLGAVAARYGVTMHLDSIADISAREHLPCPIHP